MRLSNKDEDQSSWTKLEAALPGVVPGNTGKTVWNTKQVINQLDSGSHWSGNTISYSIPDSGDFFPGSEANGFSPLNGSQRSAAQLAVQLWDDLIAPRFVQTSNAGSSDIKFSNTTSNVGYAHAYFPGGWAGAGSIWFNGNSNSLRDPDVGEYGFMTFLHELGHALGLDHAGDYNGGSPTYQNNASHAQDSQMFTIMSYFGAEETGADWRFSDGTYSAAQTPMVHDILAIQSAYGADQTTRGGNTTYGFNSNTGSSVFDFDDNKHPVLTIWDAGGNDTLDLSGFSDASIVNLEPGSYSDAGGAVNNLAIAYGTILENVEGGSGNDRITGNNAANALYGNGGNDLLVGKGGNDLLSGKGGIDRLEGGVGNDLYRVYNAKDIVIETRGNGRDRVAAAIDYRLGANADIEVLTTNGQSGRSGIDLTGNQLSQTIIGNAGHNYLNGGGAGGADVFGGLGGNDKYRVHNSGDKIIERSGAGSDRVLSSVDFKLASGVHVETVTTNSSRSLSHIDLTGNEISQRIYGNYGNNILDGGRGADTLLGLRGEDTFVFSSALGSGNVDRVLDFNVNDDLINLDNSIFSALSHGTLAGSAFKTGSAASDSNDRIIYDSASGNLFYDADGTGSGAQSQFAVLSKGLNLTNADFEVI